MPIPRVEHFAGDGATTTFTLRGKLEQRTDCVFVTGPLVSRDRYSVSGNPTVITFNVAPPAPDIPGYLNITVMYSEADF